MPDEQKPQDGTIPPQDGTIPPTNVPPQDGDQTDDGDKVPKWIRDELKRAREEAAAERVKRRKLEEAQESAEAERLAQSGEYKTLYETASTKITEQTSTIANLEKEIETLREFKKGFDDKSESERTTALVRLPEDIRDAFANATIEQIGAMERKLSASGTSPGGGDRRPPRTSGGTQEKDAKDRATAVPFSSSKGMSEVFELLSKNKG